METFRACYGGNSSCRNNRSSCFCICVSYWLRVCKIYYTGRKKYKHEGDNVKTEKTKGLDTSYAFQYSFSKAERSWLYMPNAFGGSSANSLDETSNVVKKLTDNGVPENSALQVPALYQNIGVGLKAKRTCLYWSHHLYPGLDRFCSNKTSVAMGIAGCFCISYSHVMGQDFSGFNVFLFENLPFYNKFRAPSMSWSCCN